MTKVAGWIVVSVLLMTGIGRASDGNAPSSFAIAPANPNSNATDTLPGMDGANQSSNQSPILADAATDDNNVYAPPVEPSEDQGVNQGGGHLDLDFKYVNRYVYRGVDHDPVSRGNNLNLLLEGRLSFDFGNYPHPFVGLFTNVDDADPVSRFQEIRPQVGITWDLRPFELEGGATDYIYPQRESFNTNEAYVKVTIDDSFLLHSRDPLLSPYMLSAYDYHLNEGWYLEWGIKHDFKFPDWGFVFTPQASVAYINGIKTQFDYVNTVSTTGLQHAEVGIVASYSLTKLMHEGMRYGEFDAKGYLFYDDKLDRQLTASYVIWGGAGIGFKY